jgi:hypothetical protein
MVIAALIITSMISAAMGAAAATQGLVIRHGGESILVYGWSAAWRVMWMPYALLAFLCVVGIVVAWASRDGDDW